MMIMATVCQDIDLLAFNGQSVSLLRTLTLVLQALRKLKKQQTLFITVSTQHLYLHNHADNSVPMKIASWNPTTFAPFLHRYHSELNGKPTVFVKDVIPEKSDFQQLTDVLLTSLNLQQVDKIKATYNPDLPTSCTDFDVNTTQSDVLAHHNLYIKNGYYC